MQREKGKPVTVTRGKSQGVTHSPSEQIKPTDALQEQEQDGENIAAMKAGDGGRGEM